MKIFQNEIKECHFQANLRIEYDRLKDNILLKPCCGVNAIDSNYIVNSDYFINNFDYCLDKYLSYDKSNLNKSFTGCCIKSQKLSRVLCSGLVFNQIKTIENSISTACNLNCVMCKLDHSYHEREHYLYKKVNELILNSKYSKYLTDYVLTCSGEPLLYKNELFTLLDKSNFHIHFITNGTLITLDDINRFIKYSEKLDIVVSFDSLDEYDYKIIRKNDQYSKVLNNIISLHKYKLLRYVSICIQDSNVKSYEDTLCYFINLGIPVTLLLDTNSKVNVKYKLNQVLTKDDLENENS